MLKNSPVLKSSLILKINGKVVVLFFITEVWYRTSFVEWLDLSVHAGINETIFMYYVENKTGIDTFLIYGAFASLTTASF